MTHTTLTATSVKPSLWHDGVAALLIEGTTCTVDCPAPTAAAVTVFLGRTDDEILAQVRALDVALDAIWTQVQMRRRLAS